MNNAARSDWLLAKSPFLWVTNQMWQRITLEEHMNEFINKNNIQRGYIRNKKK